MDILKTEMPADNERFGVMAAVAPRKSLYVIENLYPATTAVEAATTPSRHHVGCNAWATVSWTMKWKIDS
jgi:hypothetical protein